MLRYSRYLIFNFFKRVGVYVTAIMSAIAVSAYLFFLIGSNNENQSQAEIKIPFVIQQPDTFFLFFAFLFMVVFLVLVIIHIFKEGQQDGTELLIVSKPLSRITIIFSKFISAILLLLVWQIFSWGIYFGNVFRDNYATNGERLVFALSLSIGGFIIGVVILSLLILFSSFMGRIGIAVVSILFAAIIPVISFIVTPLTKAFVPEGIRNQKKIILPNEKIKESDKDNKSNAEYIYLDDLPKKVSQKDIDNSQSWFLREWKDYKDNVSYQNVVYVDFWYQWSRFYSMFIPNNKNKVEGQVKKLSRTGKKLQNNLPKEKYISLNGKKYVVLGKEKRKDEYGQTYWSSDDRDMSAEGQRKELKNFIEEILDPNKQFENLGKIVANEFRSFFGSNEYSLNVKIVEWTKGGQQDEKIITLKNDNLQDVLRFLIVIDNLRDKSEIYEKGDFTIYDGYPSSSKKIINTLEEYFENENFSTDIFNEKNNYSDEINTLNVSENMFLIYKENIENKYDSNIKRIQSDEKTIIYNRNIFELNEEVPVFEATPWISTTMVVIVWSAISLLVLSLAIFMYLKRDFK